MSELQNRLRKTLPRARLSAQELPGAAPLRLHLIDPAFPQESLSREEMRAVLDEPAYWPFAGRPG